MGNRQNSLLERLDAERGCCGGAGVAQTSRQLSAQPISIVSRPGSVPDPNETLYLLVEAAVAIAGFSGVIVVFGRRSEGEWS